MLCGIDLLDCGIVNRMCQRVTESRSGEREQGSSLAERRRKRLLCSESSQQRCHSECPVLSALPTSSA